ncbi:MAG: soluble NSF attachment family protein [Treponema sp.]|jgi:tetratricopeptide (TPR) repeat protein|nr:soluble NSF attachment family protein [Treponema sp.]
MSTTAEKYGLSEKIAVFIQNRRKPLVLCLGVIVLAAACIIAALGIMSVLRKNAIAAAEELNGRYEALRFNIGDGSKEAEAGALLEDLLSFAGKNRGLAGGRAWALAASVYADKKEWAEAEQAWIRAAESASKTYFEPIVFFHAGRAAEEQGNTESAIAHYAKSASFSFPSAARAQFSVGRLEEGRNNTEAALEAYRTLVSKFPFEITWVNMARTRIIVLQLK